MDLRIAAAVFCKELRKRFAFDDPVMKTIGILKPNIVLSPDRLTNTPTLQALTSKLPRCVGNLDVQTIGDEWRQIGLYPLSEEIKGEKEADVFLVKTTRSTK